MSLRDHSLRWNLRFALSFTIGVLVWLFAWLITPLTLSTPPSLSAAWHLARQHATNWPTDEEETLP